MLRSAIVVAFGCALVIQSRVAAAVTNGDFEIGNILGWSLVGSAHVYDSTFGITPTQGIYQGYIETTGNGVAPANIVASALNLDASDLSALSVGTPYNGTGLWQNVTVSAGDVLSFDWNFISDELNEAATFNDCGFFVVDGSAFLLASRNSSTYDLTSPPSGFDGQTGWATQTYTFTSAGTFQIGFGVFNVGDAGHNSALLLDAVTIPAPEPAPSVLLAAGATGMLLSRRRPIAH